VKTGDLTIAPILRERVPNTLMVGEKIRFRFQKTGDLRLLSHHDLMRSCERMLRRAEVPFAMTNGFHPTPRWVFALSLPLGVAGYNEVVELELKQPQNIYAVRDAINTCAPKGFQLVSAQSIDPKSTAVPRRVMYRFAIPHDSSEAVQATAKELVGREKIWTDRHYPRARRVNIRPFIRHSYVEEGYLYLDLWVTSTGTARADELIKLLGLTELHRDGADLDRVELDLEDEVEADATDGPPTTPAETLPLHTPAGRPPVDDEAPATTTTWGLSPNGPVVE